MNRSSDQYLKHKSIDYAHKISHLSDVFFNSDIDEKYLTLCSVGKHFVEYVSD